MTSEWVLEEAARLIERRWTKGACAVDARGHPVAPCLDDAVAWDAFGAIQRICGGSPDLSGAVLADLRRVGVPRHRLITLNDASSSDEGVMVSFLLECAHLIAEQERDRDASSHSRRHRR